MNDNARYMLDFQLIPDMIRTTGRDFVSKCLMYREDLICLFFNHILHEMAGQAGRPYTREQFRVTEHTVSDQDRILYIELPPAADSSAVYCTAYAVAYSDTPLGVQDVRFYSIEKSTRGTTCIGTMDADGNHINYGRAYPTPEQNIRVICGQDPGENEKLDFQALMRDFDEM